MSVWDLMRCMGVGGLSGGDLVDWDCGCDSAPEVGYICFLSKVAGLNITCGGGQKYNAM